MVRLCHRCRQRLPATPPSLAHQEIDDSHKKAQKLFFNYFVPFVLFCGWVFLVDVCTNAFSDQSRSSLVVGQAHDQSSSSACSWYEPRWRKRTIFESTTARFRSLSQRERFISFRKRRDQFFTSGREVSAACRECEWEHDNPPHSRSASRSANQFSGHHH